MVAPVLDLPPSASLAPHSRPLPPARCTFCLRSRPLPRPDAFGCPSATSTGASSRSLLPWDAPSILTASFGTFPRFPHYHAPAGPFEVALSRTPTRLSSCASASPCSYTFSDEGEAVEVRVTIPEALQPIASRHVHLQCTSDSVVATISSGTSRQDVLTARPLCAEIRPKETTWHLDEGDLVVILQKQRGDEPWPGLLRSWGSLCRSVADALKGCSVYLGGTCSPRVKWDLAQELAAGLGYTPLSSGALLQQLSGSSVTDLVDAEGAASVAKAEAEILQSLSTNVRVVVASLSPFPCDPQHVTSKESTDLRWQFLFSGHLVWIDLKDESGAATGPPEQPVEAFLRVNITEAEWEGSPGSESSSSSLRATAEGVAKALQAVLAADPDLPGKKSLYVRLGCRGDWPDLMPPGWAPKGSST